MDEIRVEHIYLEDGRHAEKRMSDWRAQDDADVRVTEVHVEEHRPKHLAKKIIEVRKPVVVERQVQSIDELTGEVKEQVTEAVNPTKLKVVDHIAVEDNQLSAQSVNSECDCYVTKDDLHDAILTLAGAMSDGSDVGALETSEPEVSAYQTAVEERVVGGEQKKANGLGSLLWVVIAVEAAALGYILFLM